METQLGAVLRLEDKVFRVVRIVKSQSLFQTGGTELYILDESYLELRSEQGDISFMSLSENKLKYEGPEHHIRGIEPFMEGKKA